MEATSSATTDDPHVNTERNVVPRTEERKKANLGGTFRCAHCPLTERYDYKGRKPPFARQISFSEDCYMMKDPWSPPNRGQVLVLGGDCEACKKVVCLGCSIFYARRFCCKCANDCVDNFPAQLHPRIKHLTGEDKS